MKSKPSNREVALAIEIDEEDVERYRSDSFLLGDGSWLIHFAFETPKHISQKLTKSFTVTIGRNPVKSCFVI